MTPDERKVILASSVGASSNGTISICTARWRASSARSSSAYPEATRNVSALLAFAAGFIVRPIRSPLLFGRLGDLIGRKYTFVMTIVIMGLSTFLVGLLPNYDDIGIFAPIGLIALRMAQGLALGGEYGGAATYVAEHAPQIDRGYYTSFIQTTATLGFLMSLLVILFTQIYVNAHYPPILLPDKTTITPFAAWGWRVPFMVSILLLEVSLYIRLQMNESPAFLKMKDEGQGSKAPLRRRSARSATSGWRSSRCSGSSPAKRSSGTRDSSPPCSTCRTF